MDRWHLFAAISDRVPGMPSHNNASVSAVPLNRLLDGAPADEQPWVVLFSTLHQVDRRVLGALYVANQFGLTFDPSSVEVNLDNPLEPEVFIDWSTVDLIENVSLDERRAQVAHYFDLYSENFGSRSKVLINNRTNNSLDRVAGHIGGMFFAASQRFGEAVKHADAFRNRVYGIRGVEITDALEWKIVRSADPGKDALLYGGRAKTCDLRKRLSGAERCCLDCSDKKYTDKDRQNRTAVAVDELGGPQRTARMTYQDFVLTLPSLER